jgi:DNA-binding transcriptional ArsR family regulator
MEELSALTSMSRTTLRRALVTLTDNGLVETTRTKRNLGRLYKNRYKVVVCETSTADSGDCNSQDIEITTLTTIVKNTSYSLGPEPEETSMVNKWSEEDDDQMAFGLLDEHLVPEKVSKRDPKTRAFRPQNEWTALDVASEFASRVYANVRGIPGLVNTQKLMFILANNRKAFGVTAEMEMELVDKFCADARNFTTIKKFPKNTVGLFANFMTKNIQTTSAFTPDPKTVDPKITMQKALAYAENIEYLVASDGRKFDKSMPGRLALARYEKKLEEDNE